MPEEILSKLIVDMEYEFGYEIKSLSEDKHKEKSEYFLIRFQEGVKGLLSSWWDKFPNQTLCNSKFENIVFNKPCMEIGEFRIRPNTKYYENLGKPIPKPENPTGPSATGIELSVSLNRGINGRGKIFQPHIGIEFQIWGVEERLAFKTFFYNYKRVIELLIKKAELEFSTSCGFGELDIYRGKKIIKQIDLYYLEADQEHQFTLEAKFFKDFSYIKMVKTFLILSAIYDSCLHYLCKRKRFDKILEYYLKLKE